MRLAIQYAQRGFGHTYPNPAVGCVLVRSGNESDNGDSESDVVIGAGFHPQAGFPHAEVFALWQAYGHVPTTGVQAAEAVLHMAVLNSSSQNANKNEALFTQIRQLADDYKSSDLGPRHFFPQPLINAASVTAYVTLEPCCHYGKTPPCAAALILAQVHRVVIGVRDPNPRVDGGGIQLLRNAKIQVDLVQDQESAHQPDVTTPAVMLHQECFALVSNFCKRITSPLPDYTMLNGAMRSNLCAIAGRLKAAGMLAEVAWTSQRLSSNHTSNKDDESNTNYGSTLPNLKDAAIVDALLLPPNWLERIDTLLWHKELVLLRLNLAVAKKRLAVQLGQRIADTLHAHVTQTLGHTVLLYRPAAPPILDLNARMSSNSSSTITKGITTTEEEASD